MGNLCCQNSNEEDFVVKDRLPDALRQRQLRSRRMMSSLTAEELQAYLKSQNNGGDTDRHRRNLLKRIGIYDPQATWIAQENKVQLPTIQKMGNLEELYAFSSGRIASAISDYPNTTKEMIAEKLAVKVNNGPAQQLIGSQQHQVSGLPVSKHLVENFIDYHTFSQTGLHYGSNAASEIETSTGRSRLSSMSQSDYSGGMVTSKISRKMRSRVSSFADAEFTAPGKADSASRPLDMNRQSMSSNQLPIHMINKGAVANKSSTGSNQTRKNSVVKQGMSWEYNLGSEDSRTDKNSITADDVSCSDQQSQNQSSQQLRKKSIVEQRSKYMSKLAYQGVWKTAMNQNQKKSYQNVAIFDWDDTLFCTSAFSPKTADELNEIKKNNMELLEQLDTQTYTLLTKSLESCRTVIVTNAVRTWVIYSAQELMPKTFQLFVNEYNRIPIVSARDDFEPILGISKFTEWKLYSFSSFIRQPKPDDQNNHNEPQDNGDGIDYQFINKDKLVNLMVIGDSMNEMRAGSFVQKIVPYCILKQIKMKEKPTAREIIKQLSVINDKWRHVVDTPKNFIIKLEKKGNSNNNNENAAAAVQEQ